MATIFNPKYLTDVGLNYLAEWCRENLETLKEEDYVEVMKKIHPVGTYYWSSDSTNPGQLFGGTWISISGYYMYATNNTNTGGSSTVTLNSSHMPSHNHSFSGSHTHNMESHSHSIGTHNHTVASASHYHSVSHTHPTLTSITSLTSSFYGDTGSPRNWNIFQSRYAAGVDGYAIPSGGTAASANVRLDSNSVTNTGSTSVSISLISNGSGQSGEASTLTTGTYNGSNYSLTLDPPYINAYCWYRSS